MAGSSSAKTRFALLPGHDEGISVARRRYRRRTQPDGLLRLQRANVERRSCNQEKTDEIDRVGLRRRDRPPHKTSDRRSRTGVVFHAGVLLETDRDWKGNVWVYLTVTPPAAPSAAATTPAAQTD